MNVVADPGTWSLDVVDDVEVPGWFFVPGELETGEQEQWVVECREALAEIIEAQGFDSEQLDEQAIRIELLRALEARQVSESLAIFQVWPAGGLGAVLCHVSVLVSAELPDWTQIGGVVHPIEATHIGPGMQCSTRRTIDTDGESVEVASVHLIFDNADVTLMLSLSEAPAPIVAYALPGLLALMESIRMVRTDGAPFRSIAPSGILEDAPWQLEENQ